MPKTAVKVTNLSVEINKHHVLKDVSFEVHPGEMLYILGGNGSGKSTLIKTILGLVPFQVGEISINDQPLSQKVIAANVGYVPQNNLINRDFPISVEEVIRLECDTSHTCDVGVFGHLGILNAQKLMHRKLDSLSGGEFQKVMIARALVSDPNILILDEPANNLDHDSQTQLLEILKNLTIEHHKTILLVTHDHELIEKVSSEILYINQGKAIKAQAKQIVKNYIHI